MAFALSLLSPWSETERPRLLKNLSVYFSVEAAVTSENILQAFDDAGIDIDEITSIQRRTSNCTWVVSFDSQLAKETALEVASIQVAGSTVFLGDCENRLVLVKIYEVPSELPDTAVIGCLSYYGRLLSFRRDKVFQVIENGVRTAQMHVNHHIPSIINLASEFIRIWYPNQPKTCRNCGSPVPSVIELKLQYRALFLRVSQSSKTLGSLLSCFEYPPWLPFFPSPYQFTILFLLFSLPLAFCFVLL